MFLESEVIASAPDQITNTNKVSESFSSMAVVSDQPINFSDTDDSDECNENDSLVANKSKLLRLLKLICINQKTETEFSIQ